MTNELKTAIRELEKQPTDVQQTWATKILQGLGIASQTKPEAATAKPYSSFDVLRNAHLDGPPDASVTYETKLYGRKGRSDE